VKRRGHRDWSYKNAGVSDPPVVRFDGKTPSWDGSSLPPSTVPVCKLVHGNGFCSVDHRPPVLNCIFAWCQILCMWNWGFPSLAEGSIEGDFPLSLPCCQVPNVRVVSFTYLKCSISGYYLVYVYCLLWLFFAVPLLPATMHMFQSWVDTGKCCTCVSSIHHLPCLIISSDVFNFNHVIYLICHLSYI
jgi:hypothetical protein